MLSPSSYSVTLVFDRVFISSNWMMFNTIYCDLIQFTILIVNWFPLSARSGMLFFTSFFKLIKIISTGGIRIQGAVPPIYISYGEAVIGCDHCFYHAFFAGSYSLKVRLDVNEFVFILFKKLLRFKQSKVCVGTLNKIHFMWIVIC